jgi:hypothetical protein
MIIISNLILILFATYLLLSNKKKLNVNMKNVNITVTIISLLIFLHLLLQTGPAIIILYAIILTMINYKINRLSQTQIETYSTKLFV